MGDRRGDRPRAGRRRGVSPVATGCRGLHHRRGGGPGRFDHDPPVVQHAGHRSYPADMAPCRHRPVLGRPAVLPPLPPGRTAAGPRRRRRGGGHVDAQAAGLLDVGGHAGCGLPGQPAGCPPALCPGRPGDVSHPDHSEPPVYPCCGTTGGPWPGGGGGDLRGCPREPRWGSGRQDTGSGTP